MKQPRLNLRGWTIWDKENTMDLNKQVYDGSTLAVHFDLTKLVRKVNRMNERVGRDRYEVMAVSLVNVTDSSIPFSASIQG